MKDPTAQRPPSGSSWELKEPLLGGASCSPPLSALNPGDPVGWAVAALLAPWPGCPGGSGSLVCAVRTPGLCRWVELAGYRAHAYPMSLPKVGGCWAGSRAQLPDYRVSPRQPQRAREKREGSRSLCLLPVSVFHCCGRNCAPNIHTLKR